MRYDGGGSVLTGGCALGVTLDLAVSHLIGGLRMVGRARLRNQTRLSLALSADAVPAPGSP